MSQGGGGKGGGDSGCAGGADGRPPHVSPQPGRRRNWRRFAVLAAVYSACSIALVVAGGAVLDLPAIDPELRSMLRPLPIMLAAGAMAAGAQNMWSALAGR